MRYVILFTIYTGAFGGLLAAAANYPNPWLDIAAASIGVSLVGAAISFIVLSVIAESRKDG